MYEAASTTTDPESLRAAFRPPPPPPPPPTPDTFRTRFPTESLFVPGPKDGTEAEQNPARDTVIDLRPDVGDAAATLGVHPDAAWADVVRAHRRLAWLHHPDRQLDASPEERESAEAAMRDLNFAYAVLRRRDSLSSVAD